MTVFIDTNVLVYLHDADAGERHQKARTLIETAKSNDILPFISIQVLQELYVVLIRRQVPLDVAREVIEHYMLWNVIENTASLLRTALDIQQRCKLSFWDSNIIAAARSAGAKELWTEGLNNGQKYEGILAVNPFKDPDSVEKE